MLDIIYIYIYDVKQVIHMSRTGINRKRNNLDINPSSSTLNRVENYTLDIFHDKVISLCRVLYAYNHNIDIMPQSRSRIQIEKIDFNRRPTYNLIVSCRNISPETFDIHYAIRSPYKYISRQISTDSSVTYNVTESDWLENVERDVTTLFPPNQNEPRTVEISNVVSNHYEPWIENKRHNSMVPP